MVEGAATRWRALVHDRWTLIRLLLAAGSGSAVGLGLVMVAVSLLPAATAAATAALVAGVLDVSQRSAALATIVPSLVVVGLLLVVDLTAQSLLMPIREHAAMRVNGMIRRRVQRHLARPTQVDHLQDQRIRELSALAVHDREIFNIGAAAEGQLWLTARFVGALGSATLLATYSVPLAVFSFSALLTQRAILRRQYAADMAQVIEEGTVVERAATYWQEINTSPKAGKEMRLFGFDGWAVEKFMEPTSAMARLDIGRMANVLPQQWRIFVLSGLALGVPFVVLVRAALSGDIATAQLALLLGATIGLTAIGGMGWEAFSIEAAVPQLEALRGLADLPSERSRGTTTRSSTPRIVFEEVTFRYPGRPDDVLGGLDLEIEPGASLAIVGENGAGKTTLLKLLGALHRPTSGRILVDGVDLQDLDPAEWRGRLAVVFQDFVRYELSAADNVAIAAGSPDLDALQAAADAAGAAGIVAGLPDGWSTILSPRYEGGVELSGGQWQRIALARALYAANAGASLIALDEPTANLDVHAEVDLFDRFLSFARESTMIVVSHRFSTVRRAERIIVIGEGRVIEDGDHASLVSAGGTYARLFRLQADRFRDGPIEPRTTS